MKRILSKPTIKKDLHTALKMKALNLDKQLWDLSAEDVFGEKKQKKKEFRFGL